MPLADACARAGREQIGFNRGGCRPTEPDRCYSSQLHGVRGNMDIRIELAAASTDVAAARSLAQRLGGRLYHDPRTDQPELPFRALVTATTDDLGAFESVADVGVYVVCRRVVRPGTAAVIGLFPIIRLPGLSHAQADAHWRDRHAPLALEHHAFMTHYTQISVVHRIAGRNFDGFALCGFASLEDLRHRFYTREASRAVIAADVAQFADTRKSPRRLLVEQTEYGAPPA
jgi:hypothetical protein